MPRTEKSETEISKVTSSALREMQKEKRTVSYQDGKESKWKYGQSVSIDGVFVLSFFPGVLTPMSG